MRVATFDIETNGLLPEVDTVWCAAVLDHESGVVRTFTPDDIAGLCPFLATYDVLIGHNSIQFDFPVLRKVCGWEYRGTKVDTVLMSRMQRPRRLAPKGSRAGPHSVESWGVRLGQGKVEHEDWSQYSEAMLHRCVEDTWIQKGIFHALLEEGKGEGWVNAHRLNHKLHHYLNLQEENGWCVDKDHIDHCLHTLDRWMDKLSVTVLPHLPLVCQPLETKKAGVYGYVRTPFKKNGTMAARIISYCDVDPLAHLIRESDTAHDTSGSGGLVAAIAGPFSRVGFRPVDIEKNVEVKKFLLDQGWEPLEWNTNNSGERTSPKMSIEDPFVGVRKGIGKLIAKRVQCRQRRGVIEGWRLSIRPDGRISAGVAGIAATGRLRHKGIVNVPSPEKQTFFAKAMRAIFIASPGMTMVGVDSKGNQVRQLAARMQDAEFTQAVLYGKKEDGTDLHSVNMRKAGTATRGHAKNFFYAFIFGASDYKLGRIIGGNKKDGTRLRADYLKSLPGLRDTIETLTVQWEDTAQKFYDKDKERWVHVNGYITGVDGRPILVKSGHTVLCYALQSDEAIQMAVAYVMVHKRLEARGLVAGRDWNMLIWYHDEFQMEAKPQYVKLVGEVAKEAIAWAGRYLKIDCPHAGDAEYGNNWAECH